METELSSVQPIWGAEAQGLAHRGDEFTSAVCWRGCQHSLLSLSVFLRLTSLFLLSSWIHLPAGFYHFCSSSSSVMTTKCRQPAQLCVLQSWLPGDPSVPLRQALDAGLHLCVQASLPYQCPPAHCLLPPAMPLSPPKPLGHCWPCLPQQLCAVQPGSRGDFGHTVGMADGIAALQSQPVVLEMPQPRSCSAEVLQAYPA